MKVKIIILQTNEVGQLLCKRVLEEFGLAEERDYRIFDNPKSILDTEWTTERQLFITGTNRGSCQEIIRLNENARKINPELVSMAFSVGEIKGDFDHWIDKTNQAANDNLRVAIWGFLLRILNRKKE